MVGALPVTLWSCSGFHSETHLRDSYGSSAIGKPSSSAPRTVDHLTPPLTLVESFLGSAKGQQENKNYIVKLKYGNNEILPNP